MLSIFAGMQSSYILKQFRYIVVLVSWVLILSCQKSSPYPLVIAPEDNPTTQEKVALGEKLFFDPRLSIDNTVSCASCHHPERAFTDGKVLSDGVNGHTSMRNAPSLINVVYQPYFMFEGAIPNLERQSHVPIIDLNEMGFFRISDLVDKLAALEEYQKLAQQAFSRPFDAFVLTRALAAYQRTLIQWDSPFDDFYFNQKPMDEKMQRGYQIFSEKLYCTQCHSEPFFTDYGMHNNGFYDSLDWGRWRITGLEIDKGTFKTPSLKNIRLTAPYMHNGQVRTLGEVLDYYSKGGNKHPNQDKRIQAFILNENERSDLIYFLKNI